MVENPPPRQETHVQALGLEDPLETERAAHSSILAWEIPRTEEPDRLSSMRLQRVRLLAWEIPRTEEPDRLSSMRLQRVRHD